VCQPVTSVARDTLNHVFLCLGIGSVCEAAHPSTHNHSNAHLPTPKRECGMLLRGWAQTKLRGFEA
jgi:hypothetical protein